MRKVLIKNEWEAFFHQWMSTNTGIFAIVERSDGTVDCADWWDLKFITPPEILEQPVEVGGMTKEELIEKWKAKKITIQNDERQALIKAIVLIGANTVPNGNLISSFYSFCDDIDGWNCDDETDLPTIKASEALKILTQPETIKTK